MAGVKQVNAGDLSVSTHKLYNDEIGFLTTSFNAMVAELRRLVANLEQRVTERTRELKDRNVKLALQADALRKSREEAEHAREEAELANQAKSIFLANMTHELRTPLNAILGFAQLTKRSREMSAKTMEYLNTIFSSGEHLLALVDQVLDLSKIEAGHMQLNPRSFNIDRLLNDIEAMFRMKAEYKGLRLVFERDPDLPPILHADDVKLRQILIDLLNNAVKFTERGGITMRISFIENCELAIDNSQLSFEISDTGPGIAPEELDKLFEAFEQTASGRQARKGTGLGLAISHKFAQLMGGDMQVESRVGEGCTFRFGIEVEVLGQDVPRAAAVPALEPDQPRYRIPAADELPSAIAQLPPDLPKQLRHAVEHSDLELIDQVILDIRDYQPDAADLFLDWAENFQYEQILQALQKQQLPKS